MIAHLSYVRCDRCGNPAQPADGAKEARSVARRDGFDRVDGQDVCRPCRSVVPEGGAPAVIAHTAVANLLATHGNTAAGRVKARAQIAREIRAAIDREIAEAGRSIRCGRDDHRRYDTRVRGFIGCANDGSTCLCECHDPEGPRTDA